MSKSSPAAVPYLPTTATTQSAAPSTTGSLSIRPTISSVGGTLTSSNAENGASTSVTGGSGAESKSSTSIKSPTSTQPTSSQGQSSPPSSAALATPAPSQPSTIAESKSTTSSKPTLTFKKDIVQLGTSNAPEFAPVTAASNSPTPIPSGVQYPTAEHGNAAMANGFNQIYKTLNVVSTCNANDNNQAISCISGELAQCQADGTYVLKSCPDGQSCYALPKTPGSTGVSVECALPSDAAAKLSGASDTSSTAKLASQVASAPQGSGAQSSGRSQGASPVLPQTESVQIPVQRVSSVSQTTAISPVTKSVQSAQSSLEATSASQASVAQSTESVQETSSNTQLSTSPISPLAPTATKPGSSQSSTEKGIASAMADSVPSSSSHTEAAHTPVQILSSFPPVQVTAHNLAESSTSPSNTLSSRPAQTDSSSPAPSSAPSEAASVPLSATTAVGGPLFSIPNLTPSPSQASEPPHGQATKSSAPPPQETSTTARSPSVLAQQQPAPTASSLPLPPHLAEPILSTPTSSDDGGGITIVPLGAEPTQSAPILNEKLAVGNPNTNVQASPSPTPVQNSNAYGTPIYITVTVTTTAHDHSPSP